MSKPRIRQKPPGAARSPPSGRQEPPAAARGRQEPPGSARSAHGEAPGATRDRQGASETTHHYKTRVKVPYLIEKASFTRVLQGNKLLH